MFFLANKNSYKLMLVWPSFFVPLIFTIYVLGTTNVAVAQESEQIQKIWETPAQQRLQSQFSMNVPKTYYSFPI